jgi:hypothetical protein
VKEATRKDPKGNKNIAEKAEKYSMNTISFFATDSTPLPKTDIGI